MVPYLPSRDKQQFVRQVKVNSFKLVINYFSRFKPDNIYFFLIYQELIVVFKPFYID